MASPISHALLKVAIAFAIIAWLLLVVPYYTTSGWWAEQPESVLAWITLLYLGPFALIALLWDWHNFYARGWLVIIATIYLFFCIITSQVGTGFMFLPAAGTLALGSGIRLFAPVP